MDTPNYITALLQPTGKKNATRKVWSIDLEYVWLPFFTATNVQGDTAIPHEAIGAPLRLAKAKDGSVKFSQNGRPVLKVAGELSSQIRLVRENFTASLVNYAGEVQKQQPDGYKAEVEACQKAGEPIGQAIHGDVAAAVALRVAEQMADATSAPTAEEPKAEVPTPDKELVGAAS